MSDAAVLELLVTLVVLMVGVLGWVALGNALWRWGERLRGEVAGEVFVRAMRAAGRWPT